jgi:mRNA interferase MazF
VRNVAPWQVWLLDFGHPVGGEQGGMRPAVVVASELHCRFPIEMTIVVPLTTRDRGLPHHVPIGTAGAGLRERSWARTEDITTISTTRFASNRPLGRLPDAEAANVRHWLRRMISL